MSASAFKRFVLVLVAGGFCLFAGWLLLWAQEGPGPGSTIARGQSPADVKGKSTGCISCHGETDSGSMHTTGTVQLACVDCHGGKADVQKPAGSEKGSAPYQQAKEQAHPHTRSSVFTKNSSANP